MDITIQTTAGATATIQALHEEGGLAVALAQGLKASVKRYVITHVASGCAVGDKVLGSSRVTRDYKGLQEARAALRALLPLTDWTRPAAEVARYSLPATRVLAEMAKDEATLRVLPPPRAEEGVRP